MWDIEATDHAQWPVYHAAALLDGLSWLRSLQRVEGVESLFEDGHNTWTIAPRICGRYFALMLAESGEPLLTAMHQKLENQCPPQVQPVPDRVTARLPLAWFAIVPWKARWIEQDGTWNMRALLLDSGPFFAQGQSLPSFSMMLPVATPVHRRMPADQDLAHMRTAVGNPRQIYILGNHIRG